MSRARVRARTRGAWFVCLVGLLGLPLLANVGACDSENTCAVLCPTGTRFTNDGTCTCVPFDAGYCAASAFCADASCPASARPDACGGGQLWSTAICGCYPLPEAGLGVLDAHHAADAHH